MRLVQFKDRAGARKVAAVHADGKTLEIMRNFGSVYDMAFSAARMRCSLASLVAESVSDATDNFDEVLAKERILPPLDHPDPYHCLVSGTGLSHLGSAEGRDAMHAKLNSATEMTDSMRMFKWGIEGGKPSSDAIGAAPEWFYKGDGRCVVPPGGAFELPPYARDGGDEIEIVGLYVVADDGEVLRVGYALGNEYSDHVMERQNYLYLAHSKLRQCAYGPELLLGELPRSLSGSARLLRGAESVWTDEWLSGEDNMCHSISNLEHHHFKYRNFREPGDVHVHFFGASTGSFTKQIQPQVGDIFEIESTVFGRPLRNRLGKAVDAERKLVVRAL